jgi:hypothetical protein
MIEYDCEGCGCHVCAYGIERIPIHSLCCTCAWLCEHIPDPEIMMKEYKRAHAIKNSD